MAFFVLVLQGCEQEGLEKGIYASVALSCFHNPHATTNWLCFPSRFYVALALVTSPTNPAHPRGPIEKPTSPKATQHSPCSPNVKHLRVNLQMH